LELTMVAVYSFQIRRRPPAEGVSGRGMDRAAKQLNKEMGEMWHKLYLPRHFQPGAEERYGYQPRTHKYLAMKARRGLPPLTYRGTLRQLVVSSHIVREFPTRFSVIMWGPRYATMRPRPPERGGNNRRPAIGAELVKTSPDEEREMAAFAGPRFVQLLEAERGTSTETIR
jgi:hypothetical protein